MTVNLDSAGDRLMVIAPHCDDELLGCGGIIQRALSRGIEVKVVVITNGDGFRWAAIRNFRRPFISYQKFRQFGELRQQESVAALEKLGLEREHIYFFGYPDRGLQHLWRDYWHPANHYFSTYTKAKTNPYQSTYKPDREYTGQNLVEDLQELLVEYQPTKVFVSSAYDDHADHWAVYNFFHYALAQLKLKSDFDYHPASFQYLVHRGRWPLPPGNKLTPPEFLTEVSDDWIYYSLKPEEVKYKLTAVEEYESQTKVMRKYLLSFIKDNELFFPDQKTVLDSSQCKQVEYIEPTRDTKRRRKLPGVDLEQIQVKRVDKRLKLKINTKGQFTHRCHFNFNFYLLAEKKKVVTREVTELTITPEKSAGGNLALRSEAELIVKEISLNRAEGLIQVELISESTLSDSYLFFNVESYFKTKPVDRTAWRIVVLS